MKIKLNVSIKKNKQIVEAPKDRSCLFKLLYLLFPRSSSHACNQKVF